MCVNMAPSDQLYATTLGVGVNGEDIICTHQHATQPHMIDSVGNAVLRLCETIPQVPYVKLVTINDRSLFNILINSIVNT